MISLATVKVIVYFNVLVHVRTFTSRLACTMTFTHIFVTTFYELFYCHYFSIDTIFLSATIKTVCRKRELEVWDNKNNTNRSGKQILYVFFLNVLSLLIFLFANVEA